MKIHNFSDYENSILEYRTPGSKNKKNMIGPNTEVVNPKVPHSEDDNLVTVNGQVAKVDDDFTDFKGKSVDDTPEEDGYYEIDKATPESRKWLTDRKHWSKNYTRVFGRIKSKSPFFVQGEAGWGKTTVITLMANKCGYHVIVLYTDKMEPEDLAGLRTIVKMDDGKVRQVEAPPVWAQYIIDHPNEQFLLFLDELNQAPMKVLQALMPIVLESKLCGKRYPNFFCAAAGNMSYEGDLEELPRQLMTRFGSRPVAWITGTKESWDEAFDAIHKKWDSKIGSNLIEEFHKQCMRFGSPRDIELHIFRSLANMKEDFEADDEFGESEYIDTEYWYDIIKAQTLTVEGIQANGEGSNKWNTDYETACQNLAKKCDEFLHKQKGGRSFDEEDTPEKGTKKNADNLNNDDIQKLIDMCAAGTVNKLVYPDGRRAPITHESIFDLVKGMNVDLLEIIDDQMEQQGLEWKYPHNQDAVNDKSRHDWKTYDWTLDDLE